MHTQTYLPVWLNHPPLNWKKKKKKNGYAPAIYQCALKHNQHSKCKWESQTLALLSNALQHNIVESLENRLTSGKRQAKVFQGSYSDNKIKKKKDEHHSG